MTDWWTKKLAGEKPTPPRTNLPPVQAPLNFTPTQTTQTPSAVAVNPTVLPDDATLSDYLRSGATKGGQAARKENATCPACGGNYLFSRGGVSSINPAPRCYECGWNGMYEQADQSSWT